MRQENHIKSFKLLRWAVWIFLYSLPFFLYIFFSKIFFLEKIQAQEENMPQNLSEQLQDFWLFQSLENKVSWENNQNILQKNSIPQTIDEGKWILDFFKRLEEKENKNNEKQNKEETNNKKEIEKESKEEKINWEINSILENTLEYIEQKYYSWENSYLDRSICSYWETIIAFWTGGENILPEYLSGNTIYVLQPWTYIFDYMLKITENCTTIIGTTGEIYFYTKDQQWATIKVISGQNTIIENIIIDGRNNGKNKDHEENNYGIFINTSQNSIENIECYDQKRFWIYMENFENQLLNVHYYKTSPSNKSISKQENNKKKIESNIITLLQEQSNKKNNKELKNSKIGTEYSATNEPVKVKKQKEYSESELVRKLFNKEETTFKGKSSLDLEESNWLVPVDIILESVDETIKVHIPENTIFKTEENEIYSWVILAPKIDKQYWVIWSGWITQSLNTIKVWSLQEGLKLENLSWESVSATVIIPLEWYKTGDTIDMYSSEDGINWNHLGVFDIKEYSWTIGAEVPTNHFSWISAGASYGNYFKWAITIAATTYNPGDWGFLSCRATANGSNVIATVVSSSMFQATCSINRNSTTINTVICGRWEDTWLIPLDPRVFNKRKTLTLKDVFIPKAYGDFSETLFKNIPLLSPAIYVEDCDSGTFTYDATAPSAPSMVSEPTTTIWTSNTVSSSTSTDGWAGWVQYEFCMKTSSTVPSSSCDGTTSSWTTSNSTTFSSLSIGSTYYYFVRSRDGLGNTTAWSSSTYSQQISSAPPTISFVSPTPTDNITINTNYFTAAWDITIQWPLKSFFHVLNWATTTIYSGDLINMFNFDNVSALWESTSVIKDVWPNAMSTAFSTTPPTWTSSWKYGWAYYFGGSSYLGVSYNSAMNSNYKTVFARVNPSDQGSARNIAWRYNFSWRLRLDSWKVWFLISTPSYSSQTFTTSSLTVPAGQRSFVWATYDWTNVRLYVNDQYETFPAAYWVLSTDASWMPIWAFNSSSEFFYWYIDELYVYWRALSTTEMKVAYESNLKKYDTNKRLFTRYFKNLSNWAYNYFWSATDSINQTSTLSRNITINVDTTPPNTVDNADSNWRSTDMNVILSVNEASTTRYCVDTTATCTPTTIGTNLTVSCAAGTTCPAQYVRYYSVDTAGNIETTRTSPIIRIDKQAAVAWTFTYISWIPYINWSNYWVKGGNTFIFRNTYSDTIGLATQYLSFAKDACYPNSCWDQPYEIKSYITTVWFNDWMANDNYLNIITATCSDSDGNCFDNDNLFSWTTTVSSSAPDRDYKVYDFQYDHINNGNGYNDKWIWIKIDNSLPTTSITAPAAGSAYNWNFNVSFSDSDSRSWIWSCFYRIINNGTQSLWRTVRTCNWSITINQASYCPTNWTNTCVVESYSTDNVWNNSSTASRSFSIDTVAPTSPTCTTSRYFSSSLSISCSAAEWTIKYTTNGTAPTCSSSTRSNQSFSSTTTLRVWACDTAGNISSINSYIYNKDSTNPNGTYNLNPSSATNGNVIITFTPTDNSGVASVQLPNGSIITGWVLPTLIDPNGWVLWTNWSQPSFSANGTSAENTIISKINPRWVFDKVWASETNDTTSDADWGWISSSFSIDKTKKYRSVVWIRRENIWNGRTYFGTLWSHVANLSDWSTNTNPYFTNFLANNVPEIENNRVLLVAYIHPYTYSNTTSDPTSWIYTLDGRKIYDLNDFKRTSTATLGNHRTYLYYSTSTSEKQYRYRPRFEEVNGNEPTIEQLLKWSELANPQTYTVNSNGTYNFIVRDRANNSNTIWAVVSNIDTTPPTWWTFSINWWATYTKSTAVSLNITCPTDPWTPVQIAYGNTASPTNWTNCSTPISHTLTSTNGTKTVYTRFRDWWYNTTANGTKTIILDTITPTVETAYISAGTTGTNGSNIYFKWTISLKTNVSDSNLDTTSCIYTTNGTTRSAGTYSSPSCYINSISPATNITPRFAVKDLATNVNTGSSVTYYYDATAPSFTFSNASWPECTAGSLTISSASDGGVWLHTTPYSFNGTTWSTTTSTSITAQQPWSVVRTGWVRDTLGNSFYKTATYTFNNTAPTASNFTGHASVGNTARTANWLTASNVQEWTCWNTSITYSGIITQATKGICSVSGTGITYTPNTNQVGTDSCVIQVKDNENSTINISVYRWGIDTTPPTAAPTCTASQYFSGSLAITCTVWAWGSQIRYTTNWVDPSPNDTVRSNQSFSSTTTLKAISCDALNNCNLSAVETEVYTLDNLAPISSISDTNSNRRNTNLTFTLTGSDAWVKWVSLYYKILSGDISCNAGGFSSYTYPTAISITGTFNQAIQRTICYYSTDSLGNTESYQKQVYKIDMSDPTIAAPAIYAGTTYGIYFKWSISLRSFISDIWAWILASSCMRSVNAGAWTSVWVTQDASYCMYNSYSPAASFNLKFLAKDQANNTGISLQSDFSYDATAPTIGLPTIYAGTTYNNAYYKGTINIQATATDIWANINTSTCEYSLNNWTSRSAANFAGGYCQITGLSPTTNLQTLIRAKDNLGTTGISSVKTYTYDNTAPVTTNNATSTRSSGDQTITLSASDTWAGVANTYYCITTSGWNCTPTIAGTSILVTGTINSITSKQIKYYSTDNLNTDETIKTSPVINIDKQAPTGWSFSINNNAEKTNTRQVELVVQCPTDLGIGEVEVAYGNGEWWNGEERIGDPISNRQACHQSLPFQLPSGDWIKTVYMIFRDTLWNITNQITDTIELDTATRSFINNKELFENIYWPAVDIEINVSDENDIGHGCFFNIYKNWNLIVNSEPRSCNDSFYINGGSSNCTNEFCLIQVEVFAIATSDLEWFYDSITFNIDGEAPEVHPATIYTGTQYNNTYFKGNIGIQYLIRDAFINTGSCIYSLNNWSTRNSAIFTGNENEWYCQVPNINILSDFSAMIRIEDKFGNESNINNNFIYDNTAPTTINNIVTNRTTGTTITLSATDTWAWVANTYYCITNSGWSCTPNITWTSIAITWTTNEVINKQIKYYSNDKLNTDETIKTSTTITIDKQWPTIELTQPANGLSFDEGEQILLVWSGNDGIGIGMSGYLYEIYNSNNEIILTWATANTWIMVSWLTEDNYIRKITAYDLLYNESISDTGNFVVQSSLFVIIPNTSSSWTIQTAFINKDYELIDNKLLWHKPISLKYSNTICPDVPIQIFSSWTSSEETTQIEFPWCFKVKTNNVAFTGIIEAPTIQDQASAFSLINNTKDSIIFAGLSGQKIDFVNQSEDPTTVKVYIPSQTRDLNTIMDVYYSQDGTQWNYFWTGEVTSYSGQKYTIIETNHFTYFTIGTTTGNFVINNDQTSTLSRDVTLHMNVQWATHMKFWHSTGEVESASRLTYNTTYNRELTEWTGTKTVYAMFTNGIDTWYVSDTIVFIVDTQWPTQANIYFPWNNSNIFLGNNSIKWTTSIDTVTWLSGYKLQISKDNFSSIEKQISTIYTDHTENFTTTGTYQLRILSIDNAGNITTGDSLQINVQDNIIEYYFGSGSKFTENRQANNCNTGDISIVYVYNYSGYWFFPYTSLWSNKIYILQEGTHIANNQIIFNGNCIALVWENPYQAEQKTILYSNTQLTNAIYAYQKNNIIIDNIQIDGTKNGLGGNHTANSNGINRNQTTSTTVNNFSVSSFWAYGIYYNGNNYWLINRIDTYKNHYGLYLGSSTNNQIENIQVFNNTFGMRLNYANTNTYNNSKFFNNTSYWVHLWSSSYNVFNNSIFHNNNIWISAIEVWYNYLFNSIISQNTSRGIEINASSHIITINTSIIWNQDKDIFRDTRAGIFKYYGYLKTNTIENNTLTTGWNDLLGIGISSGYIVYDNSNSYNEKINIKNQSGINLYNWTNPIYWRNTNRDFLSWTFSFGKNIPTKEQPIKRSGTSLIRYNRQVTDTTTSEFIASKTKKTIVNDSINKQITTGDNQRVLTLSWNNIFYSITGNISEETWWTVTSIKNIPILLSWGEEKKRIITQTWKDGTNWETHYETISIIDTTPPTTPQNVFVKNITATTGVTIERSPSIDSWAGISWYIYQISTASDFSSIQHYGTTQEITTTIEWLQETTQYYLRVKAIDNVGYESDWNNNLSFTISEEIENLVTDFYFGSGNIFTRTWNSQCDPSQIQIIKVPNYQNLGNNTFPYSTLNANTIYVLEEGVHILGNTVTFNGECSALVGKGTKDNILWKVELYSNAILTNMIVINGNKRIIDNLIIDWTNNGISWTHSANNYWIIASSVSNNSIFNTTARNTYSANIQLINSTNNKIKNVNIYNIGNNVYGIQLNNADGNILEHINMYNNSYNAIVLENGSNNNIVNNVNIFNNNNVVSNGIYWIVATTSSTYNTINNCIINNNGNFGIRLWSDYNSINNCIINNNEQYGIVVTSNNNILSDIIAFNNVGADIFTNNTTTKLYNNIKTHKTQITNFVIGGDEFINIWLSTGNIELNTSKNISRNNMINVINKDNNRYLSPRINIFRWRNTTRTTTGHNIEFSLGQEILLQKPVLYYSWTTLQTLTWTEVIERNPTKFVGTKTTKIDITASIDKLYTSTADTTRTITLQYPWTINYSITGDITQTYNWTFNNETGINITLSETTEWMKNIIIQTRITSGNRNHSYIKTYLDNTTPTKPSTGNISWVSSDNDNIEIFWNKGYDNGSEISWYYYEISLDNSFSLSLQTGFTEYNSIQISWVSWYQELFTRVKTVDTTNKESDWLIIGWTIESIKNQNQAIISKYFSPQNYYTKNRNTYWCTKTGETKIFILEPEENQDFFFGHLNENSIYILKEWVYNINDSISFERWCTVLTNEGNEDKIKIVSSRRLPSLISLIMTNNNIIENIFLNGEMDKNGITHTRNNANIYTIGANNNSLYRLEAAWWSNSIYFYSSSSYNSLENIICYKNTYCTYIYWWWNYNTFNNIIMHNNYHGIHVRWPWYNTFNNMLSFNNDSWMWFSSSHNRNVISNSIFANNNSYWISFADWAAGTFDILSNVSIINNGSMDIYTTSNSFLKYYNSITWITIPNNASQGWSEFASLWWMGGQKTMTNTNELFNNSINILGNKYLWPWWNITRWPIVTWIYTDTMTTSFGKNIPTQTQPVRRSWSTLVYYWTPGIDWNPDYFIWSTTTPTRIQVEIDKPISDSSDISRTIILSWQGIFNYNISWNLTTNPSGSFTNTTSVPITLSSSTDGAKNIVVQVRTGNNNSTHYQPVTFVDSAPPTTPLPIQPLQNYTGYANFVTVNIDFEWSASTDDGIGMSGYVLEISTGSNFSTILYRSTWYTTTKTVALKEWAYYRRVRAFDNALKFSLYSAVWPFYVDTTFTQEYDAPSTPTILSPNNKTIVNISWINIEWTTSIDTGIWLSGYIYQISTDTEFTNIILSWSTTTTGEYINNLNDNTYFIKVAAIDYLDNISSFSPYHEFTIDTISPSIIFTGVTPEDNSITSNNTFSGTMEITEANIDTLLRNRNGTNYPIYDSGLILMMNFDNKISLGETTWWIIKDFSQYENHGVNYYESIRTNSWKYWWSYLFDWRDDHIQVNNIPWITDDLTISLRIKPTYDWITRGFLVKGNQWTRQNNEYGLRGWSSDYHFFIANEYNRWQPWAALDNLAFTIPPEKKNQRVHVVANTSKQNNTLAVYLDWKLVAEEERTIENIGANKNRELFIGQWYSWTTSFSWSLRSWYIDEVRIYNRSLSSWEIQQLYKSNLSKYAVDKRLFSIEQSCLADGWYNYGIATTDLLNNTITTWRNISVQLPNLTIGSPLSWLKLPYITTDTKERTITGDFIGNDNTFRVYDSKGYTWWYTTIQLSWDLRNTNWNLFIPQENIAFKADNSITTLEGIASSWVILATGINEYKTMTGIYNYIIKNITPECSSCIVGKYGNNPSLKVTIPAFQKPDTYNGTLIFTLYN